MGSWNERVRQSLRSETEQARRVESDRLERQRAEEERKRNSAASKAEEEQRERQRIYHVLDRVDTLGMLAEINRDVWRGMGRLAIRDREHDSPGRILGLYYDYDFDSLVQDSYRMVKVRRAEDVTGGWSAGDGGYTWVDQPYLVSLKHARRKGTSSLIVVGSVHEDSIDKRTTGGIEVFNSIWRGPDWLDEPINQNNNLRFQNDSRYYLGGDDCFADKRVREFLEKSFLDACVRRTKNGLLPFQLGQRVAEDDIRLIRELEDSKRKIPWYRKLI